MVASFNAAVLVALRGAKRAWVCLSLLYAVVLRDHRIDPQLAAQTAVVGAFVRRVGSKPQVRERMAA
eukprot:9096005-Alexandrium_andersonii.AAC.1